MTSARPRRRIAMRRALPGGLVLGALLGLAGSADAGQYAYVMPPGPAAPWVFSATAPGFHHASTPSWSVAATAPSGIRVGDEARLTLTFPAETLLLEAYATYDRFVTSPNLPPHTVVSQLTTEAGLGRTTTGPTAGYDQLLVSGGQPAGQRQVIARVVPTDDLDGWGGAISTNPTSLRAILTESTPPAFTAFSSPAAGQTVEVPAIAVSWQLHDTTAGPAVVQALVDGAAPQTLWAAAPNTGLMTGQATAGQPTAAGGGIVRLPAAAGSYQVTLIGFDVAGNLTGSLPITVTYRPPAPASGTPRPADPPTPPPPDPPPPTPAAAALRTVVTIGRLGDQRRRSGPGRPVLGVVYGGRVAIAGRLRVGPSPRPGAVVELVGPDGRVVGATRSGRGGLYLLRARILRAGRHLVRAGSGDYSRRTLRIALAPRVRIARTLRVPAGRPMRVTGRVSPAPANRGRLAVVQWRPPRSREWEVLKTGRVSASGRVLLTRRVRVGNTRPYSFRLRLVLPADSGRPAGRSRTVIVAVAARR